MDVSPTKYLLVFRIYKCMYNNVTIRSFTSTLVVTSDKTNACFMLINSSILTSLVDALLSMDVAIIPFSCVSSHFYCGAPPTKIKIIESFRQSTTPHILSVASGILYTGDDAYLMRGGEIGKTIARFVVR